MDEILAHPASKFTDIHEQHNFESLLSLSPTVFHPSLVIIPVVHMIQYYLSLLTCFRMQVCWSRSRTPGCCHHCQTWMHLKAKGENVFIVSIDFHFVHLDFTTITSQNPICP